MLPDDDAFGLVRSSSVFIAVWQHFLPVGRRSRSRRLIIAASTERRPPLTSRVIVNTSQYTFSVFTAAPCVLRHVKVKLMSNLNLCSTKLLTCILWFSVGSETISSFSFHNLNGTQVYFFLKMVEQQLWNELLENVHKPQRRDVSSAREAFCWVSACGWCKPVKKCIQHT